MAARKQLKKEWPGPLGEPIVIPLHLPAIGQALEYKPHGLVETMEKLYILSEHYGVEKNNWLLLALAMAQDLVPGFKTVYDDPLAATMGLPVKGGMKANRAGSGTAPELELDRLLALVDAIKVAFKVEKNADCARLVYDYFWPKPTGRLPRDFAKTSIKTIERRIYKAGLRRDGPMRRSNRF